MQQKHPELTGDKAPKFPNTADSWMGGNQNDPLSEFVLKRKLDLEVRCVYRTRLWHSSVITVQSVVTVVSLFTSIADVFQGAVWGVPYLSEAPQGAGVL